MANLFELESRIGQLADAYDNGVTEYVDENGEVHQISDLIDSLDMELGDKVANIAMWIKNYKADIPAMAEEIKNMQARKKAKENKVEALTNYLTAFLNGRKVKDAAGRFSISYRNSKAVEVIDENAVPSAFLVPQPAKVDKKAAGDALKSGAIIPGLQLVERTSTIIK